MIGYECESGNFLHDFYVKWHPEKSLKCPSCQKAVCEVKQ